MRHIQNKNDWFYELKPQLLSLIGVVGLLNLFETNNMFFASQICGFVLLFSAFKISNWRKEYRKGLL